MEILIGLAVAGVVIYGVWYWATGGTSIKTTLLASQSAVVIQDLLEMQGRIGQPTHDPGGVANRLVARVLGQSPHIVSGVQGRRPHKLSLAAISLAAGLEEPEYSDNSKDLFFLSLGTVLLELTGKPFQYALSGIDHQIIDTSQAAYLAFDARRERILK